MTFTRRNIHPGQLRCAPPLDRYDLRSRPLISLLVWGASTRGPPLTSPNRPSGVLLRAGRDRTSNPILPGDAGFRDAENDRAWAVVPGACSLLAASGGGTAGRRGHRRTGAGAPNTIRDDAWRIYGPQLVLQATATQPAWDKGYQPIASTRDKLLLRHFADASPPIRCRGLGEAAQHDDVIQESLRAREHLWSKSARL
jgi:hypothetical protein